MTDRQRLGNMTSEERDRQLAAAWNDIRRGLGGLGEHLEHARKWVGDRAFITLCDEFEPGEIIIACGIANADELLQGYGPRRNHSSRDPHDVRLTDAVAVAHAALGPSAPRSAEDIAAARAALDEILKREGEK